MQTNTATTISTASTSQMADNIGILNSSSLSSSHSAVGEDLPKQMKDQHVKLVKQKLKEGEILWKEGDRSGAVKLYDQAVNH